MGDGRDEDGKEGGAPPSGDTSASDPGRVDGNGASEPGAAPVDHEPVSCPNEKCGAPAGTSWPWASDQGASVELYGKCIGCLYVDGELTDAPDDEKRVAILKLAAERGVPVDQAMEPQEIEIGQAILMKLEEIHQTVRRDGMVQRLGIGALIRMQTGGSAELPEPIVKALGIDPAQAESEAVRSNLAAGVAGVDPGKLKRGGGLKH